MDNARSYGFPASPGVSGKSKLKLIPQQAYEAMKDLELT